MRKAFLLLILPLFLTACGIFQRSGATTPYVKQYFPAELRMLAFGLPLAEAVRLRPGMTETDNQGMDFRRVFLEKVDAGNKGTIVYYFDQEGDQPLYEFIIEYNSETARDKEAAALLGKPNFEDSEWQYDSGMGFVIHAWTFQKKLVIVGKLPGTEWAE